jgi:hypothetical protein
MRRFIIFILICFFYIFSIIYQLNAANDGKLVTFQLIAERDGRPIGNRNIFIYNGDIKLNYLAPYNPYPYNDSMRKEPWYITSTKTDKRGNFALNLSKIKSTDVIIQIGKPYDLLNFELSSDISHTKSRFHIRIVRLRKGETLVLRNDIYDLRKGIVKEINLDGTSFTHLFDNIILYAQNK